MAMANAMIWARIMSSMVVGRFWRIVVITGWLLMYDRPRFPLNRWDTQMAYCWISGLSRPRAWCIALMASGVALKPSLVIVGSPGKALISRNEKIVTARTTGIK